MLKEHMRVHDNIREYLCAECGKGECVPRAPEGPSEPEGIPRVRAHPRSLEHVQPCTQLAYDH